MYAIYGVLTLFGLMLRFILKLAYTDPLTGFYADLGFFPMAYTIVLAAGILGMLVLNQLRGPGKDHALSGRGWLLPILAILSGAALALYMWNGLPNPLEPLSPAINPRFAAILRTVNVVLGYISAGGLIVTGIAGLSDRIPPGILLTVPPIWQIVLLLSRFNGYHSILHIADYMLIILFMMFASLFYVGHGRIVSETGRKDGRNYIISTGLCTSACGFLLVIPNYIYMLFTFSPIPVSLFSIYESIYVLLLSSYALAFVVRYTKSLGQV